MAAVQSLGLDQPTALTYLAAESVLPLDPPPALYKWRIDSVSPSEGTEPVEEEVLITERCVVWSRSGIVKRVYNLDIEGERILQAFTTWFAKSKRGSATSNDGSPDIENASVAKILGNDGTAPEYSPTKSRATKPSLHQPSTKDTRFERGLVVILKTQVHIFLLSGDSHVIPLSFEADAAFPCPRGFVVQRRLDENEAKGEGPPLTAKFASAHDGSAGKLPTALQQRLLCPTKSPTNTPRFFAFSEILGELGLLVTDRQDRKQETFAEVEGSSSLSGQEEILYISPDDELGQHPTTSQSPLCIALTQNLLTHTLTIWHVTYLRRDDVSSVPKEKAYTGNGASHRKSSNIFGRMQGAATPTARAVQPRESFGALAQSLSENISSSLKDDLSASHTTDLEAQLVQEFGEVGVQTRSARRVSSMLARTDLSTAHERAAFNDVSGGNPGRKSINRSTRRGDSIASFGDRQSFVARRRSSFPANISTASNGTSFLEVPSARLSDELNAHDDLEGAISIGLDQPITGMAPQLSFRKVKSTQRKISQAERAAYDGKALKIFPLLHPPQPDSEKQRTYQLSLCIMDRTAGELTIIALKVQTRFNDKHHVYDPNNHTLRYLVRSKDLHCCLDIIDACRVKAGSENRILTLMHTRDGQSTLHLEAPWSPSYRVDLPTNFLVFNPFEVSIMRSPERRRETGQKRVIRDTSATISALESGATSGDVLATDHEGQRHRVRFQLTPTDPVASEMLDICRFVLPDSTDDGFLIAWWEVMQWLKRKTLTKPSEVAALVVVIFAMVLPFVNEKFSSVSSSHRRKKSAFLRSSSGTTVDMTSWTKMLTDETPNASHAWPSQERWRWSMAGGPLSGVGKKSYSPRVKGSGIANDESTNPKSTFIVDCIANAREFLQTPSGEAAIGPEGYLPTAMGKDRDLRRTAVAAVLIGLHLYREEKKLCTHSDSFRNDAMQDIGPVLAQLGQWLGWKSWTCQEGSYYEADIVEADRYLFEESQISVLEVPPPPFNPPSIFSHLEASMISGNSRAFPTLLLVAGKSDRASGPDGWLDLARKLTPRLFAINRLLSQIDGNDEGFSVENILDCGIGGSMLESFPDGVATALRRAIALKELNPRSASRSLLKLNGHAGLHVGTSAVVQPSFARSNISSSHEAVRDYHSIGNIAFDADTIHSWDTLSEADRQGTTRLIFREDRRFQEASKLVNQTRPPVVECTPEPDWSEADLLEAQKELAHFVARRTLSVASGRGMMHFNARVPLLTERVPIPAFSLQCVMKPRQDAEGSATMTFSADKASFTEDKVCWAFFHNGASAGLMISRDAKGIDTSWILYNKPPELTNRHAGFLLALGLTGHLKNLAKWVAFKYLTPKHTMTSIGLLLGLSASYLGTMDTLITRLLSVHVTRLLPPGAAELNLSSLTQATSVMGIGLLYCGSQHRRMSEIMLSEIENNDPEEGAAEETILRDEGYRLAAGFSLGFINLGQGKRLHGLHDLRIVERLLTIAIGTKNVNLVHVLDRATAGATVAVALVFMKTNDESMARKIDIPDTTHQFDYVRPDIFLLRTVARHLIMWNRIEATIDFVKASLPATFRHRSSLRSTKHLSTEDMPFFNIIAGICLSIGLRHAGSGDVSVRDLLVDYLDQFIRLTRLSAPNYDAKLTRNSVRNCQDVVALATSAVMAGTGDLVVLRRLRSLHGRTDAETPYGSHLAAHMAIGSLFLGGGTYTFGTSNLAVASLLCAFYPLFPTSVLDNKSHLQAFRHLWSLAAESRCITPRDTDTQRPVTAEIEVKMKNGSTKAMTAPALLPELVDIASIRSKATEYWDMVLDFSTSDVMERFKKNQSIFLRRRAAYEAPTSDLFVSELQALAEGGPAPSVSTNANAVSSTTWRSGQVRSTFEWLLELELLKDLDVSERALVLPPHGFGTGTSGAGKNGLTGTVVDTRLELEKGILDADDATTGKEMSRDQLWQLRLLFAWSDRREREERATLDSGEHDQRQNYGNGWLRQDVIDRLRWRIWKMTAEEDKAVLEKVNMSHD